MQYCTVEDILTIIPEQDLINLTNDNPSCTPAIDQNVCDAVGITAGGIIDGYLRGKYTLPLEFVPEIVRQIACDICAYRLYNRRPQTMPEHIKTNHENALKLLKDIQKGDFKLETPEEVKDISFQKPKSSFLVNKKVSDKIFDERTLRAFGVYKNAE